jgi:hypothetical protein
MVLVPSSSLLLHIRTRAVQRTRDPGQQDEGKKYVSASVGCDVVVVGFGSSTGCSDSGTVDSAVSGADLFFFFFL